MKTTYITFRKSIVSFMAVLALCLTGVRLSAQSINGTQQLPNRGLEEYDNLGKKEVEPVGWNSFMTAQSAGGIIDRGKDKRLDRVSDRRPGTAGSYSLKAYSTSVIGINANGNVTTGRINMGSTTATDASNHNFTDRESEGFNLPFTTIPDSMVVWVKYAPDNASDAGQIKAVLHGDYATIDPGTNMNEAVAVATVQPQKDNGGFIRYSVPFDKTGCGSKDPRYMLVSITTNKTPGGGGASIYVDDILFVYNPVLTAGVLPASSFNMKNKVAFSIPFTVTGTLPLNSNSEQKNRVVAEISDAAGSFANPRVIGSVETEESGSVEVEIPSDMPLGDHYRIRLRATDRQILSEPSQEFSLIRGYTVRVTADANQGIVSGAGAYVEDATAVLVATPLTGYHFVAWMEGQDTVSKSSKYRFTVNADRNLTALFAINTYTVKILVEGEGTAGTVTGRTEFNHNERVRLAASPAPNYAFDGYYANGVLRSTNEAYSFNIVSDMVITAKFVQGKLRILATTSQPDLGSVTGGGLYEYGSRVILTANPLPYCNFVAWMEGRDTVSREDVYIFEATASRSLTAVFGSEYHYVSVQPNMMGAGVLTGGGRYSAAIDTTTIILTATPNPGYEFLYWESADGTIVEDAVFTVLERGRLTEDLAYTAYFQTEKYIMRAVVEPSGAGTVEGTGEYEYQQRVTLRAIPEPAYNFYAWVRVDHGMDDTSYDNPLVFPVVEWRSRDYRVLFTPKRHTVSLSVSPASNYGTVCGEGIYNHFDTAELKAEANPGYEFLYWGVRRGLNIDKVSEENPCRIEMLENVNWVAVFSETRKQISVLVVPEGAGRIEGEGLYVAGTYAHLDAAPNHGYRFSHWESFDGSDPVTYDTRLNMQVKNDTTVRAVFSPTRFTFTLMSEGSLNLGHVQLDGGVWGTHHVQEVYYGQTVTIKAVAKQEGYKFTQWRLVYTENGVLKDTLYSRNSEETFVVQGDARIVAYFYSNSHNISAMVMPDAAYGKVRNQGAYRDELWMELVAVPNEGYAFSHWKDLSGNVIGGTSPRLQIQSLKDSAVHAFFKVDTMDVRLAIWGGKYRGSVSGEGLYEYGQPVTVKAEPVFGYAFAGWYEEADTLHSHCLSTDREYTFNVRKDTRMAALFKPGKFTIQATIEPEGAGTVSGLGSYDYLSETILHANPVGGYALRYFLLDEPDGSVDTIRESSMGFRMYRNKSLRVFFEPVPYSFQAFSSNEEMGTVISAQPASTVSYGSEIEVTAQAKENYVFSQWRDAYGNRLSSRTTARHTVKVSCDTVIYADFNPAPKAFRAEPRNIRQGRVSSYYNRPLYGSVVEVEAIPVPGYEFDGWVLSGTEDTVSHSSVLSLKITQDTSFDACFKPTTREIKLNTNINEGGDVWIEVGEPDAMVNAGRYLAINQKATVELHAKPSEHYTFTEWRRTGLSRDASLGTDPVVEIETTENMEIVAIFSPKMYSVNVSAEPLGYGEAFGTGMFAYGTEVTVRAESKAYDFKGWRMADAWISDELEYTFNINRDMLLTAVFEQEMVEIALSSKSGGNVAGGGRYAKGSTVTLRAEPMDGYVFNAWRNADNEVVSDQTPYIFTASESAALQAEFVLQPLQCRTAANAGGTVLGGGDAVFGSIVHIEAVPDKGYRFVRWESENYSFSGMQENLPLLEFQIKENIDVTAVFEAERFRIATAPSPVGNGTVTAGDEFDYGVPVTFVATPDNNHTFACWTLNGEPVSTEPTLRLNVEQDAGYVAVFSPKRYNLVTGVYPEEGGLSYGGGSYYWNDTAVVGIYLYDRVKLEYWSDAALNTISDQVEFRYPVEQTQIFTATVTIPETEQREFPDNPFFPDTLAVIGVLDNHNAATGSLHVYPNPALGNGDIHFQARNRNIISIRIFSMTGKQIMYRKFSERGESWIVLHLPQLEAGCYFYDVRLVGNKRKLGKLMIL